MLRYLLEKCGPHRYVIFHMQKALVFLPPMYDTNQKVSSTFCDFDLISRSPGYGNQKDL